MAKLALEQDVLALMGQQERVGNVSNANQALELATTQIENHIGTKLTAGTHIDYFGQGLRNIASAESGLQWIMNLTYGFVDSNAAFEVYVSTDGSAITDITAANAELIPAAGYSVDYRAGRVTLYVELPSNRVNIVAVKYTHGFVVNANDQFEEPEPALCEAAKGLAIINMQTFTGRITEKTPYEHIERVRRRQIASLLNNYIRVRATGADPQASVEAP